MIQCLPVAPAVGRCQPNCHAERVKVAVLAVRYARLAEKWIGHGLRGFRGGKDPAPVGISMPSHTSTCAVGIAHIARFRLEGG